jgi:hypothetical protein
MKKYINNEKGLVNYYFFNSFIQANFLKKKSLKSSYDNFFWNQQHFFFIGSTKKRGCFVTKNGHSYSKLAHLSRFKVRQYQELGLLPLLKK